MNSPKPWMAVPVSDAVLTKQRKGRNNQNLVNPNFLEYSKFIKDPFWIDVLVRASRGKFPTKFSYKEKTLSCKRTNKVQNLILPEDPLQAVMLIMEFFKKYAGLHSEEEQKISDLEIKNHVSEPVNSWSKVKKKMKKILVHNYVGSVSEYLCLSTVERNQFRDLVNQGLIVGYFGKDNIVVENNSIKEIEGIIFDKERRTFYRDASLKPKISKSSKKAESKKTEGVFYLAWEKYVSGLSK